MKKSGIKNANTMYNPYQKAHFNALYGAKTSKHSQPATTAKKWALYAGNQLVLKDVPYPVLESEKRRLAAQNIRFLKIKPLKQ